MLCLRLIDSHFFAQWTYSLILFQALGDCKGLGDLISTVEIPRTYDHKFEIFFNQLTSLLRFERQREQLADWVMNKNY